MLLMLYSVTGNQGANQCILVLHSVCKTPCMVDKSILLIIWSSFSPLPYGAVLVLSNNCCYGSILTTYVYMYPLWIVKCYDYNGIKLCCQILLWTANMKVFLCVFKGNLLFWNAHTGLYIFTQNVVNHLMIILFWPACKL